MKLRIFFREQWHAKHSGKPIGWTGKPDQSSHAHVPMSRHYHKRILNKCGARVSHDALAVDGLRPPTSSYRRQTLTRRWTRISRRWSMAAAKDSRRCRSVVGSTSLHTPVSLDGTKAGVSVHCGGSESDCHHTWRPEAADRTSLNFNHSSTHCRYSASTSGKT